VEPASQYVPPTPSRKATSIRSIPTPAWTAVLALMLAPLVLSLPASNQSQDQKDNNRDFFPQQEEVVFLLPSHCCPLMIKSFFLLMAV
jgi:hypothetical protein